MPTYTMLISALKISLVPRRFSARIHCTMRTNSKTRDSHRSGTGVERAGWIRCSCIGRRLSSADMTARNALFWKPRKLLS